MTNELIVTDGDDDAGRLVSRLVGRSEMATAISKLTTVMSLSQLSFIKETKAYRSLKGLKSPTGKEFSGVWADVAELLGISLSKLDDDLMSYRLLGEDALNAMTSVGLGVREIRQLRRLPDDEKTALIEAARTGDKDTLLDLAESIMVKHAAEKEALTARTAELEEEAQRLHRREANYEAEIERATLQIKNLTSAKKKLTDFSFRTEEVREECMALGKGVEVHLNGLGKLFDEVLTDAPESPERQMQLEQVWVAANIAASRALDLIAAFEAGVNRDDMPDRILSQHCLTPVEAEKWLHDAPLIENAYEGAKAAREARREAEKPRGRGRPKGSTNQDKAD